MHDPGPALAAWRRLLEKWRVAMDLVGPGPLDPHFEDAVAAVRWLDARGEWVDLGSGAGFPGLALAALHPAARVTLVERRQKRCAFLEQVVAEAKLANALVRCGDAADLPRGAWDGVVARAYRPAPELIEEARGLLKIGGVLVLLLAREAAPPSPGFEAFHVERYAAGGHGRSAVGLRRTA
ncbi:MAG: 16S rRNA (guanine(527)-N(7))-methyltransferase RsmG [Myxococcota bacterium]